MKKTILLAFLLMFAASTASAQMNSGSKEYSFLGLGGGIVVPLQDYPADVSAPPMFKLFAGRMLDDFFGIQGEIAGLVYPTGGGTVYDFRGSLLMKLMPPTKVVQPYFLLGTGGGVKVDSNVTYGLATLNDIFTFLIITGLGVQFEVTKGLFLYAEGQVDFNIGGTYTAIDIPILGGVSFALN